MSLYGKNTKSIRKKDIAESKVKPLALNKIQFWHQAIAGETGIDLGSLVMPSAVANNGNSNPSSALLLEQNLFRYKDSVRVVSSLTGELMKSSFKISGNSRITWVGFTAQEGEYFEVTIDPVLRNGVQVVDSRIETASGTVPVGATDFNLGFETSTQREELILVRNNLVMQRNTNNSSTVQDGDYYIVDSGSGAGVVARFNTPASGEDDKVFTTAVGNIIDAPSDSTFSALEVLQGQLDAIIPTLADLAGVPESTFRSGPNSVALKAFGDRLIALENIANNKSDFYEQHAFADVDMGAYGVQSFVVTRIGNLVTLTASNTSSIAATSGASVPFIPSHLRPSSGIVGASSNANRISNCEIVVRADGGVSPAHNNNAGAVQTGAVPRFSVSWTL